MPVLSRLFQLVRAFVHLLHLCSSRRSFQVYTGSYCLLLVLPVSVSVSDQREPSGHLGLDEEDHATLTTTMALRSLLFSVSRRFATSTARSADSSDLELARRWLRSLNLQSIPRHIGHISFSRSSGPGGQNVNKSVHIRKSSNDGGYITMSGRTRLILWRTGSIPRLP